MVASEFIHSVMHSYCLGVETPVNLFGIFSTFNCSNIALLRRDIPILFNAETYRYKSLFLLKPTSVIRSVLLFIYIMLSFLSSIISVTYKSLFTETSRTKHTKSAFSINMMELSMPSTSTAFLDLRTPAVSTNLIGTPEIEIFAST